MKMKQAWLTRAIVAVLLLSAAACSAPADPAARPGGIITYEEYLHSPSYPLG